MSRLDRCACGKVLYPTELDALRAAARIIRNGRARRRLFLYRCSRQPHPWHLCSARRGPDGLPTAGIA